MPRTEAEWIKVNRNMMYLVVVSFLIVGIVMPILVRMNNMAEMKPIPEQPAGLVERQKMVEQTDRLLKILESKCFSGAEGFPEDGAQVYNLN